MGTQNKAMEIYKQKINSKLEEKIIAMKDIKVTIALLKEHKTL